MFKSGTLEQIAEITMGQSPEKSTVNNKDGIPLLNGPSEFGLDHPHPIQFTSDPKRLAKKGDLLFCVRGSTGKMNWADQNYAIGRGIASIRPKTPNSEYFIRGLMEFNLKKIKNSSIGSVITGIKKNDLFKLKCPIPRDNEMINISHYLGNISKKIEINQKTNRNLNEIAKKLFKSWFVDFEPVNAKLNGKTTGLSKEISDLFPNNFKESKLGKIPQGWTVTKIENNFKIVGGCAFESKDYLNEGIFVLRTKNLDLGYAKKKHDDVYLSNNFLKSHENFICNPFDYHLVMVGASIGKTGMILPHTLPALRNQNMWLFKPLKNEFSNFMVKFIVDEMVKKLINFASGSARDFFRKGDFYNYKLCLGSEILQNTYYKITQPFLKKIDINLRENIILKSIRDFLNPKLITGELLVSDVEKINKNKNL